MRDKIAKELLFLDGGMGTLLQERGLLKGELPERWNIHRSQDIVDIHRQYFEAGSQFVLSNTFGANGLNYEKEELEKIVIAALLNAKEARRLANKEQNGYIGLDIGPLGHLLEPNGDLSFEEAVTIFSQVVKIGEKEADFIHIETMSDTYELKACVLAAKENSELPIFATVTLDSEGKLLTGGSVACVVALLEGLRVDALGFNCSMGPEDMQPFLQELKNLTSLPIIIKPNAGLPKEKDGQVYYDVTPNDFALGMKELVLGGGCIIGGCCGTTPAHIQAMVSMTKEMKPAVSSSQKKHSLISSFGKTVEIGKEPIIIGERINPTGKKRLQKALKEKDLTYILQEGLKQEEAGAHVLDVNVGLPEIDEVSLMPQVIKSLQSVTTIPLQIDTVDVEAMEQALRCYNGKALLNSVNGKKESMEKVFPLVKKYGAIVVALLLDENGIPETVEGRLAIAEKIFETAKEYGISKKDILVDPLALTVSAKQKSAMVALDIIENMKERDVHTVLGVSNISFGLPGRSILNSHFYANALHMGLSAGIINPLQEPMMDAYYSHLALHELDSDFGSYIEYWQKKEKDEPVRSLKESDNDNLGYAIEKGLTQLAHEKTKSLLLTYSPMEITNTILVPALDKVGEGYEKGTIFLPQLLMSAEASKEAFSILQESMEDTGELKAKSPKIMLATVEGDIHDIGKNIVKALLGNYGYSIYDLGKDVSPEYIANEALKEDVDVVGLSALMTTTVQAMKETINLLRQVVPKCKVMVGGAVLNEAYARELGADFYGKDAASAVKFIKELEKQEND